MMPNILVIDRNGGSIIYWVNSMKAMCYVPCSIKFGEEAQCRRPRSRACAEKGARR